MKQVELEELVSSLATKPVSLEQIYDGVASYFAVEMRWVRWFIVGLLTTNEKAKIRQVLQVLVSRRQMTRDWLGQYQSTLSCRTCGEPSSEGHRSCEKHLEKCREKWRKYQEERVAKNRCITARCLNRPRTKTVNSGGRTSKVFELRCATCASKNTATCREWTERQSCS